MSLLDDHPLWKRYVEERDTAQERLATFQADERERWAPYHRQVAEHRERALQAAVEGKPPPPKPKEPVSPWPTGTQEALIAKVDEVRRKEPDVLRACRADIEAQAAQAEEAELQKAAGLVDELEQVRQTTVRLLADVHRVRVADEAALGTRTRTAVSVADVVEAASVGASLLALTPQRAPLGRDIGLVQAGDEHDTAGTVAPRRHVPEANPRGRAVQI
jgi:hypothetical protein